MLNTLIQEIENKEELNQVKAELNGVKAKLDRDKPAFIRGTTLKVIRL